MRDILLLCPTVIRRVIWIVFSKVDTKQGPVCIRQFNCTGTAKSIQLKINMRLFEDIYIYIKLEFSIMLSMDVILFYFRLQWIYYFA